MSYYDDASLVLIPSGVKTSKVYSQKPTDGTGDLTFSRASIATRTNSAGLIEKVRTNLQVYSEQFDNSVGWVRTGSPLPVVTANQSLAPNGTNTADKIVLAAVSVAGNSCYMRNNTAISSSGTNTSSVYLKGEVGGETVYLFMIVNSVYTSLLCTLTTNWQRFSFSYSGGGVMRYGIGCDLTAGSGMVAQPAATIYAWGAQVEVGSFVSTYIPTTTAAVTRVIDSVSISGASALIGQTEGTIFLDVDFRSVSTGGIRQFFALEGSVANQFSGLNAGTTNNGNNVNFAGTNYNLTQGRHKIVCRYNSTTNESKLFVDGAQRGASTFAAFLATIDRISVLGRINPFASFAVDRQQFGGCNQFVVFKTALSDAQCIELTTL